MAASSETEIECMFCRKLIDPSTILPHLEACSQRFERGDPTSPLSDTSIIDVVVKTVNGARYEISGLNSSDTVLNLKNRVKDECGTAVLDQLLTLDDKQLEDDKTLKHYDLKQGQLLHCIGIEHIDMKDDVNLSFIGHKSPFPLDEKEEYSPDSQYNTMEMKHDSDQSNLSQIYVKTFDGRNIVIHISLNDNVFAIKRQLECCTNLAIHNQMLLCSGHILNDHDVLSDNHIDNGSILNLVAVHNVPQQIQIRTLDDELFKVSAVQLTDTISSIKQRIESLIEIPIPSQKLIFNGEQLENISSLKQQNIPFGGILHLLQCHTAPQEIYIKDLTGYVLTVQYKKTYTVRYIKSRIQDMEHIPVGQQRLVFHGRELDDDMECEECQVENQCTMQLVRRLMVDDDVRYLPAHPLHGLSEESLLEMVIARSKKEISTANTKDTEIFSTLDSGKLIEMLEDHLIFMRENEQIINDIISEEDESMKSIHRRVVATNQDMILHLMTDMVALSSLMQQIVAMVDVMNEIVSEQMKNEQIAARQQYVEFLGKYESVNADAVLRNDGVTTFSELMDAAKSASPSFEKWLDLVVSECETQNIPIVESTGIVIKGVDDAFYEAFYMKHRMKYNRESQNGYMYITDIVKASLVFGSFEHLYGALGVIDGTDVEILKIEDGFNVQSVPFGYRYLRVNLYCPNTRIVCELQLHHRNIYCNRQKMEDMMERIRLFEGDDGVNIAYQYAMEHVKDRSGWQRRREMMKVLSMNGRQLLIRWGLGMYIEKMVEIEGWDDPMDWHFLEEDELRNDIGFKLGHFRKFQANYLEWRQWKKQMGNLLI